MISRSTTSNQTRYAIVLATLLALFCFRVLAQLLQRHFELPFLPPFAAWHSGVLPYNALLATQILIVALLAWVLRRLVSRRLQPSRGQGLVFLLIGLVYFLVMAVRLFVGVTGMSEHYWFRSYLATLFHFVLSGYLIVLGHFHLRTTARPP